MEQQQANPKRTVILAVLLFLLAAAAFAAAFYFLDGMALIDDFVELNLPSWTTDDSEDELVVARSSGSDTGGVSVVATDTLRLPEGMTEEFALRLWQEQIDSQANILKLVNGEVVSFELGTPVLEGDRADIPLKVTFVDQTSVDGLLVMNRVEGDWYTAYIQRANDPNETTGSVRPRTPLPDADHVDIEVLNTLISQQQSSRHVLSEYAEGVVSAVEILDVVEGVGTRTLEIEMTENHEVGRGRIVCLTRVVNGEPFWFVAKFTKL